MLRKKVLAAALLLGLAMGTLAEALPHSDDGCVVETHCSACLLRLGTTGVTDTAFALPRLDVVVERVAADRPVSRDDDAARTVPSRGPPVA